MQSSIAVASSPQARWRADSAALIAAFHERATYGVDQKKVEAAILDLASEYLLAGLGERAAWDAFDAADWRAVTLTLDDGYRRRAQATLARFFDSLAASERITAVANARIQEVVQRSLGDNCETEGTRASFQRRATTPETDLVNAQLSATLKGARR